MCNFYMYFINFNRTDQYYNNEKENETENEKKMKMKMKMKMKIKEH